VDTAIEADRREQVLALLRHGDLAAASDLIQAELAAAGDAGGAWLSEMIVQTMQTDDLRMAGDLARISTQLRHGGRLSPADRAAPAAGRDAARGHGPEPPYRGTRMLSAGKLRHDIDQLRYLRAAGVLAGAGVTNADIDVVIAYYEQVVLRLEPLGPEARQPLSDRDQALIGDVYGRLVHVRDTPRLPRTLSPSWDPHLVEEQYLHDRPGVVVIDDFLEPEAVDALRNFCLESTVWNANRYPNGRLGAFFDSGFNCPLLLQIAEELRAGFPRAIGRQHRLRQLWGFKYPPRLPGDSTIHADFAAVNVNFWITPERANRNPDTGGLVIYHVDAPLEWDFASYNRRLDLIRDFLRRSRAKVTYVPYRQNRAIIFNSDLFHATAEIDFEPAYEDRRINITMLYGVREDDDAHPALSSPAAGRPSAAIASGWRSAAFARTRSRP
jgi:hypothetical protein